MEYFMYPSMFHQFNVYNNVGEPGRMYLPPTLELLTFIRKLLIFMGKPYWPASVEVSVINGAVFKLERLVVHEVKRKNVSE